MNDFIFCAVSSLLLIQKFQNKFFTFLAVYFFWQPENIRIFLYNAPTDFILRLAQKSY